MLFCFTVKICSPSLTLTQTPEPITCPDVSNTLPDVSNTRVGVPNTHPDVSNTYPGVSNTHKTRNRQHGGVLGHLRQLRNHEVDLAQAAGDFPSQREREFFIDNLLVRNHFIIVMSRWTGLATWEFEFPFPGSLTSTFAGFPATFGQVFQKSQWKF